MRAKNKATLPVGCPPYPEPSEMSIEQLDETRDTLSKLNELCDRVADGEKEALPEMRHLLDQRPDLAWHLFDFAGVAEQGLMECGFGEGEISTKSILRRQLQLMRVEIAGQNPSPLERLLTERVVVTWLEVQTFESLYRQNERKLTLIQAEYQQKRLDSFWCEIEERATVGISSLLPRLWSAWSSPSHQCLGYGAQVGRQHPPAHPSTEALLASIPTSA